MSKLEEVFGIRSHPVKSYVERSDVDARFRSAVSQDSHIVIYGSSKQGKTALRLKHIPEKSSVVCRGSPNMTTESIYRSVLRQSGIRLETTQTGEKGSRVEANTKVGFRALIPLFGGADAEIGGGVEGSSSESLTWEFVGYDLAEAQAIGELLQKAAFKKFVVLENYHYLPEEAQKQLAFDLKTFHEMGIRFIVLGIWQEANLLLFHNSDLQDRIVEVPVEPWKMEDFDRVIRQGCQELNLTMSDDVREKIKTQSYGNVGLLQELLRVLCEESGVSETRPVPLPIDNIHIAEKAIDRKLNDQRGHLLQLLQSLAAKSRTRTDNDSPLLLPYYLVQAILTLPTEQWRSGVSKQQLQEFIRKHHHRQDADTPRTGDITNLVSQLPTYQKDMSSPFLHYNVEDRKLRIVDMRYYFVLANTDRTTMWEDIPNPANSEE